MLIKRLKDCAEIQAGDRTRLRELLHPLRDAAAIRYSLAVARLSPGAQSQAHRLSTAEVYYLVRGSGVMHIGDEAAEVNAGDAVYIPPGSIQWLENTGREEVEFLCIVDPAWRPEDEQIL
ncbi:cupin domain-containing protein [candidate division WOR-3 bacterium]|uniref:Cupin domain-containing protein n=1 Tax=candidate division WOR-3 bacterium TaxID=2052148 RepID=A0A937XG68_UNCW3|nr:cupin domain-containing protein [candidate division WOR-3 bacterium]